MLMSRVINYSQHAVLGLFLLKCEAYIYGENVLVTCHQLHYKLPPFGFILSRFQSVKTYPIILIHELIALFTLP